MGCLRLSSRHRQPSMHGPRLLEDSCHACSSPSTSTTSTPPSPFYSELFSAVPAKRRPGYANFAIGDPALKLVLIEKPGSSGSLTTWAWRSLPPRRSSPPPAGSPRRGCLPRSRLSLIHI